MKKITTAAVLTLFLAAGLAPLQANEMMGKSPQERQEHMTKHLDKMTKELSLTPAQQATVKQAMQTKMDKMDAAMQEADNTIKACLDQNQVAKYQDKMMSQK